MQRSLLIGAVVYLLAAVVLSRLPLFNYLGYEFSASISLLVPLIAGLSTIKSLSAKLNTADQTQCRFLGGIFSSIRVHLLLLLLPLGVITLNLFLIKNCSYAEGLFFFLLIPAVTVIFSCALAALCCVLWRRAYLMFIFLNLLMLGYPLYIGFVTPQIYSYNIIYGFFPGISYDEILEISSQLVLFRLVTLLSSVFMILLGVFFLRYGSPGSSLTRRVFSLKHLVSFKADSLGIILFGIILVFVWIYRAHLGFESPVGSIQKTLSIVIRTEHFRVHYAPGSFNDEDARLLAAEHEYRFKRVRDELSVQFPATIDSYIYPDAETKRQYIGTGTTNIAKPWRREMHLNKDSWEATLEHELVHVMAGEFGMPMIRANYNIGIVEGLAMAVDEDYGNRTLHEYAAAMMQFDLVRDPGKLIAPAGFMLHASSVSYVLMGSFCKFLIDRYGMLRFKQLYGGKSPVLVYGSSFEQLAKEWEQYLDRVEVPGEWENHVRYFFARPSIFAKECARTVARMNELGWKTLEGNAPEKAMEKFSLSLQKSWNTEAFNGLMRSAYRAGKYDTVIALMIERKRDSSSISNLLLYYGDALWYRNDNSSAQEVYRKVAALDLSDRYDEVIAERLAVLDDAVLAAALREYFIGKLSDSTAMNTLNHCKTISSNPVVGYLRAKLFIRQKHFQAAINEFEGMSGGLGNAVLDESREQWIAACYFKLRRFQEARLHYWLSLNFVQNEASIGRVEENIDRCEWYAENLK